MGNWLQNLYEVEREPRGPLENIAGIEHLVSKYVFVKSVFEDGMSHAMVSPMQSKSLGLGEIQL